MKNMILLLWRRYAYLIMIANLLVALIHPMVSIVFTICMLGPAITGSSKGRFWCGNICPIGNFFDNFSIKVSGKYKPPIIFKAIYVKIIVAIIMMGMFIYDMKLTWGNGNEVGFIYFKMIVESIIIGTLLSLLYNHRVWCHFCPMGSMGALTAKLNKDNKVLRVSYSCTSCRKCSNICPMGVSPSNFKGNKISSSDCIQCGKCKNVCPQNAIFYDELNTTNNLALKCCISTDIDNNVRTIKLLEEKLAIALIFTVALVILSLDMVSSHLISNAVSYEKLVILELIFVSIIIFTCIDFFQLSLESFLKRCPNIYSVITVGVLSWYVYEILVAYLIITDSIKFIHNINFLFIAITITIINFIRYLHYTDKLKLFKIKK